MRGKKYRNWENSFVFSKSIKQLSSWIELPIKKHSTLTLSVMIKLIKAQYLIILQSLSRIVACRDITELYLLMAKLERVKHIQYKDLKLIWMMELKINQSILKSNKKIMVLFKGHLNTFFKIFKPSKNL